MFLFDNATALLTGWGQLWGVEDLASRVCISESDAMRRALGRCTPATGSIRLNSSLHAAPPHLREEVLCHEAAHVAVYLLRGRLCRPHGPEWARLMQAAGFEARARLPLNGSAARTVQPPHATDYVHRCPVCQFTRRAKRPVPQWRCADCVAMGLDGHLIITKSDTPA